MLNDEIVETNYDDTAPVSVYSPEVINLAKKIFQLSITGKCTSSDIALEAAKIMLSSEPDFAIAKFIAGREQLNKNYDVSLNFYDKAIEVTQDNNQKAEIYFNKAQLHMVIGNKEKSRKNAKLSISSNPNNPNAYKLIGNLYMTSYEDCKESKSRVEDRLVFIAAYNMFKKGGLISQANQAREQFPSMEELFNENLEIGQTMNVGCWIKENVVLNKRNN
jgi:tetratricopeptide (TPR) repeat protein